MKNVTVAMASEAAEKITQKAFQGKVENAEKELQEVVDGLVKKYIPDPVLQCGFEFLKVYKINTRHVKFIKEGSSFFQCLDYHTTFSHPDFNYVPLSQSDWLLLVKVYKNKKDLESKKDDYCEDVRKALVSLRSKKRIEEHFPEALPYLNFSESTALVPDYSDLRNLLK